MSAASAAENHVGREEGRHCRHPDILATPQRMKPLLGKEYHPSPRRRRRNPCRYLVLPLVVSNERPPCCWRRPANLMSGQGSPAQPQIIVLPYVIPVRERTSSPRWATSSSSQSINPSASGINTAQSWARWGIHTRSSYKPKPFL